LVFLGNYKKRDELKFYNNLSDLKKLNRKKFKDQNQHIEKKFRVIKLIISSFNLKKFRVNQSSYLNWSVTFGFIIIQNKHIQNFKSIHLSNGII